VLQFLPMIAMGLQAMSALSAAKNVAKGYQQTPAETAQLQSMANRDRLLKALLDPNDTVTKNVTAGENQALNASTQQQLSNLLAANRKAQSMGRQTYFNPERTDESISQFLMKASDSNANTARSNALNRILQASTGYGGAASGYGGMVANQQAAQQQNRAVPSTLFGAGADALKSGGSLSNIFQMLGNQGGGVASMFA
jgi:hypothetical protein